MPIKREQLAWHFKSDLSLAQVKERLDAGWPRPWRVRDSDTKPDSISGPLTSESSARIFEWGREAFVVNFYFESEEGDVQAQLNEAKEKLLNGVLPLLQARDVHPCERVD